MTDSPAFVGDDRPAPRPAVDFGVIDDAPLTLALFDEVRSALLHLNPSASAIWLLCDGETTVHEMEGELVELFGLDPVAASESIQVALDSFWRAGLLVGSPIPGQTVTPFEGVQILPREPDP